jgi:hypothetical protein
VGTILNDKLGTLYKKKAVLKKKLAVGLKTGTGCEVNR